MRDHMSDILKDLLEMARPGPMPGGLPGEGQTNRSFKGYEGLFNDQVVAGYDVEEWNSIVHTDDPVQVYVTSDMFPDGGPRYPQGLQPSISMKIRGLKRFLLAGGHPMTLQNTPSAIYWYEDGTWYKCEGDNTEVLAQILKGQRIRRS